VILPSQPDLPKLIEAARQKLTGLTLLINNAAVQFNYDFAAA
jgi:short-subunit dehydrogenase involved in D-alanine esterification of teichoic acids